MRVDIEKLLRMKKQLGGSGLDTLVSELGSNLNIPFRDMKAIILSGVEKHLGEYTVVKNTEVKKAKGK